MQAVRGSSPPPPPPPLIEVCDPLITDPPPPYPSRERGLRASRSSRGRSGRTQTSHGDHDARIPSYVDEDNAAEPNETTPFLSPSRRAGHHATTGRPRSHSLTSTISPVPSLTHTVLSLFQFDADDGVRLGDGPDDRQLLIAGNDNGSLRSSQSYHTSFFSSAAWKRYFRPLSRKSYYIALFHLAVVNFPYTLAAWVYLFIFTLVRHYVFRITRSQRLTFFFSKKKRQEPLSLLCYLWALSYAFLIF